jgi:multidrug efflux pump subunit AcrA (membrane-fusion protein)
VCKRSEQKENKIHNSQILLIINQSKISTMKGKFMIIAALLGALTFGACVDTEESSSVTAIRNAKAEQLKSIATLNNAKAQAEATIAAAEAQLAAAQAQLLAAEAAALNAETEAVKIANQIAAAQAEAEIAAIEGIKVGDIALIAEFESTIPLELAVTTTLYNKDEEVLPTKIGFVEGSNTIEGSEDGVTPVKKPMRLLFDLADESGSLAELKEIAMIGLRIEARSAVEEGVAPLMDKQYIAAEIKLEIDGGVTVDLGKLLNKVENKVEDTIDELE